VTNWTIRFSFSSFYVLVLFLSFSGVFPTIVYCNVVSKWFLHLYHASLVTVVWYDVIRSYSLSRELRFGSFDEVLEVALITRHVDVSLAGTRLHLAEQRPALAAGRRPVQLPRDARYVWVIDEDTIRSQHFGLAFRAKPLQQHATRFASSQYSYNPSSQKMSPGL